MAIRPGQLHTKAFSFGTSPRGHTFEVAHNGWEPHNLTVGCSVSLAPAFTGSHWPSRTGRSKQPQGEASQL